MRVQLKTTGFKHWWKRVNSGVNQKHLKKLNTDFNRFKCLQQSPISLNKASKCE